MTGTLADAAFAVALTVAAYAVALAVRRRFPHPLTTPVLIASAIVVAALCLAHVPYARYRPAQPVGMLLLQPACAALGVKIYGCRHVLLRESRALALAIVCGTVVAVGTGLATAAAFALPRALAAALVVKSVTAPVALQLAPFGHIDAVLCASVVVATGTIGASVGPALLSALGIREPVARGIALGTIAHGIGTAQAAFDGEAAAAAACAAMSLTAVLMSLVAPPLLAALSR